MTAGSGSSISRACSPSPEAALSLISEIIVLVTMVALLALAFRPRSDVAPTEGLTDQTES